MASAETEKRTGSPAWRYFDKDETRDGISKCTVCGENVKHPSNSSNL